MKKWQSRAKKLGRQKIVKADDYYFKVNVNNTHSFNFAIVLLNLNTALIKMNNKGRKSVPNTHKRKGKAKHLSRNKYFNKDEDLSDIYHKLILSDDEDEQGILLPMNLITYYS